MGDALLFESVVVNGKESRSSDERALWCLASLIAASCDDGLIFVTCGRASTTTSPLNWQLEAKCFALCSTAASWYRKHMVVRCCQLGVGKYVATCTIGYWRYYMLIPDYRHSRCRDQIKSILIYVNYNIYIYRYLMEFVCTNGHILHRFIQTIRSCSHPFNRQHLAA